MPSKFYLTTPIYYVNARPHIGHAYTTIVADVLARRHRLLGDEVYFLTGTDEHGQKIERSAAAAGIAPQQFADEVSASFSDLWARMGITHDQFIRTTSPAHKQGVQQLFRTLYERGHIYLSSYTGQYSVGEEMFVEGPPGTLGPDGRPTETVTEENFFFRLSDYQLPLLNLIESDTLRITPESRKNEVLSFLRGPVPATNLGAPGLASEIWDEAAQTSSPSTHARTTAGTPYVPGALRDLSISRSSFTWGIPVPQDIQHAAGASQPHIIYVWLDALANYITALGYGSDDTTFFDKFWRTTDNSPLHLVGKEIIRFHCVYWPAFLLAANLPLPKQISAHGWLLFDDSKMSKSKGNIVRTETILDAFGTLCPAPPPTPSFSGTQPQQHVILSAAKDPCIPPDAPQTPPPTTSAGAPGLASETWVPLSPQPTPHDRDLFAADVLRYFLLREISFGQDGSFTFEALITRYNADLANGYGNLVSRTLKMVETMLGGSFTSTSQMAFGPPGALDYYCPYFGSEAWTLGVPDDWVPADSESTSLEGAVSHALECRNFGRAIELITSTIKQVDTFLSIQAPWKVAKTAAPESPALNAVLYTAAESIRIITILLHPILPYATTRVWQQLDLDPAQLTTPNSPQTTLIWGGLKPGTKLGPLAPIFPRADKSLIQKMIAMENTPKQDLTAVTANNDATHPDTNDLPETPIADQTATEKSAASSAQSAVNLSSDQAKKPLSRLVDETSGHTTITNPAGFDPAAGPRTTTFAETAPGNQVAASAAPTPERPATPPHTEAPASGIFAAQPQSPQITIDDFARIDLRVAQIVVAERIPKADKLLRLEVDLGTERRQILSGIAEWYTPEDLLGRRIVVIANLAPRKMRGLESHGMLLAASTEGGKPHLATFTGADDLPLGSRLR